MPTKYKNSLKYILCTLCTLCVLSGLAIAAPQQPTVNPVLPTNGSQITSSVLRGQFSATYNDLLNIYTLVDDLQGDISGINTYNPASVSITGGSISGLSPPLPIASGGTGANTQADARTALGLGTMALETSALYSPTSAFDDVAFSGNYTDLINTPTVPSAIFSTIAVSGQSNIVADSATDTLTLAAGTALGITTNATTDTATIALTDNELVALAGCTAAADKLCYFNGASSATTADLTSTGRSIMAAANIAAVKTALSLSTVATTGAYSDLSGTPSLAAVATSGAYSDLVSKPTAIFKTIAVPTQSPINASTTTDTLNVLGGANIVVTTNPGTNSLTITGSGVISGTVDAFNVAVDDSAFNILVGTDDQALWDYADDLLNGLRIGTNVQAYDAGLQSISGLTTSADKGIYTTASDTYATYNLTAGGRSLGGVAGTADTYPYFSASNTASLQAITAGGRALGALTYGADLIGYTTSSSAAATTTLSSFGRTLIDDADATTARATLGSVIGTNVQAFDSDLSALAATASTGLYAVTGTGTSAVRTITGTTNQVNVSNGNGVSGNPTLSLPQSIDTAANPTFATLNLTAGTNFLVAQSGGISGTLNWSALSSTNKTVSFPNSTGTVQLLAVAQTVQNKTNDNTNIYTTRDDRLTLQDDVDATKQALFQLSGITAGQTRTYTTPDASGILALTTSNVATATALAADPSDCTSGQFAQGINASGVAQGCTALPTTITGTANEIAASASTGAVTLSLPPSVVLTSHVFRLPNSTTLPATCTVGDAYMDTDATSGARWYLCESTNTWVAQGAAAGGTVTSVSVTSGNGFAGSVATATTTPAITLSTTVTGIVKGNGTAISAATAGTDYTTPSSSETVTNKDLTSGTNIFPTFNQNTTGSAAKWTTARNLAGNSVDGSANVAFANKFIVQGTTDTGLSGAQFLGALGTGIVKNTTSTGVLSIASAGTDYEVPLTFSTGLTRSTNTVTVNTSQNIATLSNLTSNGFVTTSGGVGTLGVTVPGTGVSTWIATPSSANFFAAITDESGSGAVLGGTTPTISTPVLNGTPTGTGVATGATASTLALRDANGNLSSVNLLEGYTTTATAAGTTTLTVASNWQQYFTGATTQTVTLPVTSTMVLGQSFLIVNNSTGAVTVNSSGGNAVTVLPGGTSATVTVILTSGTTAASWSAWYGGDVVASGKKLTVSNTLTLTGTDASSVAFGTGGTVLYSGGALGTPSSGTATNLTGTASGLTAGAATALAADPADCSAGSWTSGINASGVAQGCTPDAGTNTITGATTITGTSTTITGIPTTARHFIVVMDGASTNGTSLWELRLGDSGGAENTGYLAADSELAGATTTATSTSGFIIRINQSTVTAQVRMQCDMYISGSFAWTCGGMAYNTSGTATTHSFTGTKATSAALDRVTFTSQNGTDTGDAGSMYVIYW